MAEAAISVRVEIGASRSHLSLPAWGALAGPATSSQAREPAEPGARPARGLTGGRRAAHGGEVGRGGGRPGSLVIGRSPNLPAHGVPRSRSSTAIRSESTYG